MDATGAADPAAYQLLAWLSACGMEPPQLDIVSRPGRGRCLFTRGPVKRGEALLHVPASLVMTTERAEQDSCLGFEPGSSVRNDALTAWLCEQLHYWHTKHARAAEWGPWMAVIPEQGGTVLDWPEGEADRLLAGSGAAQYAGFHLAGAAEVAARLEPLIAAAEAAGAAPAGMFTGDALRHAYSLVISRAWAGAMAPFADLLNHDCEAVPVGDAVPGLDDRDDSAFVLRANRDYAPGEEVLISYGPNSSTQLLCQYGFAPPPGANANEAAYLVPFAPEAGPYPTGRPSHKLPADPAHRANGALPPDWYALPALFVDLLVTHTDPRVLGLDVSPEAAEALMRMQSDPYANLFDLPSRGAAQRRQWNPTADFMALEALRRACLAQLAGYLTSAEEDQGLAAGAAEGGGMEQRAPLCAAIRLQERATLAGAVAYADGMLERSRPFMQRMQQQGAPPYQDIMRPGCEETETAGRGVIAELQRLGLL